MILYSCVNKVLKNFANEPKIAAVASNTEQVNHLQSDLVHLSEWSKDWQRLFNVTKCKVIHSCHKTGDVPHTYTCSCSCHIFLLFQLTTLTIHNSLSLSLPTRDFNFNFNDL